jgi:hypothetical protein
MKTQLFKLSLSLCLLLPALAEAGNQWMMQRNAETLIELNNQLLQELQPVKDGKIHIEALVFSDDSKANQVEVIHLTPVVEPNEEEALQASDIFDSGIPYRSKIRIGEIDVSGDTECKCKPLSALEHDNSEIKDILSSHPEAKYYELMGAPVEFEGEPGSHHQNKPKYIIYW